MCVCVFTEIVWLSHHSQRPQDLSQIAQQLCVKSAWGDHWGNYYDITHFFSQLCIILPDALEYWHHSLPLSIQLLSPVHHLTQSDSQEGPLARVGHIACCECVAVVVGCVAVRSGILHNTGWIQADETWSYEHVLLFTNKCFLPYQNHFRFRFLQL